MCVSRFLGHIQAVDSFVSSGMATLSTRPESIEEIGEANSKHSQLQAQKPEVLTKSFIICGEHRASAPEGLPKLTRSAGYH